MKKVDKTLLEKVECILVSNGVTLDDTFKNNHHIVKARHSEDSDTSRKHINKYFRVVLSDKKADTSIERLCLEDHCDESDYLTNLNKHVVKCIVKKI